MLPVSKINKDTFQIPINQMNKAGLKRESLAKARNLCSLLCKEAMGMGLLTVNYGQLVQLPKKKTAPPSNLFRPLVEGVKEPQSSAVGEYTKAYTVLAQNQILTAEAYALLCRRYKFEKQKIVDYTKRMPLLKRQYHDLKRLEALAIHPTKYLQEIYSYSERAYLYTPQDNRSVDNIVHEAYTRSAESIRKSVEEKSIDTK